MRKLAVTMAVLLGAGIAAAEGTSSSSKSDQKSNPSGDRMQTTTQESGRTAESRDQTASASSKDTDDQKAERDQMKKDSFDIKGKVSKVASNELTLSRDNGPSATLHVDQMTKVEVDGQQSTLSNLQPGQDVKASFNLKGDKPTAIEIKAEKMKGQSSSGSNK